MLTQTGATPQITSSFKTQLIPVLGITAQQVETPSQISEGVSKTVSKVGERFLFLWWLLLALIALFFILFWYVRRRRNRKK
ncbi:hypothetical protein [Sulfobacillus thermosulfidooxidans]|uniref:hypothetical protein n=1 Tax=Sulfobacillus thermosulfidooxidans TaxID=28034 RepID=UPI0006B4AF9D|nr:hypothetical protein [Sulfobacillus thermosulfidooxidans]